VILVYAWVLVRHERGLVTKGRRTEELESFKAGDVAFIKEKDGKVEVELKMRLVQRFRSNIHVAEAYLALVRYGHSPELKVALCLKADKDWREEIAKTVGREFREMFKTTESLDILFLSPEQQQAIAAVAKPFYEQRLIQA
jgi:SseB protein C-terminal domain